MFTVNTIDQQAVWYGIVQPYAAVPLRAENRERTMFTLNTIEQHAVCYGIDQQGGKSNCGCAENVMPTLCSDSHGTPHAVCFQLCGDRNDPSVSVSENAYCVPANPMSDRGQAVCYAIEGHMVDRNTKQNGRGWRQNSSPALNTQDRHAVCYGMSSNSSNSMKSKNPYSGIYEADTSRTLDLNGGNPACNQGGGVLILVYDGQSCCANTQRAYPIQASRMDDHHISVVCHERKE